MNYQRSLPLIFCIIGMVVLGSVAPFLGYIFAKNDVDPIRYSIGLAIAHLPWIICLLTPRVIRYFLFALLAAIDTAIAAYYLQFGHAPEPSFIYPIAETKPSEIFDFIHSFAAVAIAALIVFMLLWTALIIQIGGLVIKQRGRIAISVLVAVLTIALGVLFSPKIYRAAIEYNSASVPR